MADDDDLARDVNFALRHKLAPRIKWKDDLASQEAARRIVEHLRLCGWQLSKRPPAPLHSVPRTGPGDER